VAVALAAVVALLCAAEPALASKMITRNASKVVLKVDAKNRAVLYYTQAGHRKHPAIWGAVNARPSSMYPTPQVDFKMDYSGGFMKLGFPLWKTIKNTCRPYDGPALPLFVTGCRSANGSLWAVQRWQRMLPALGYSPWTSTQRAYELHLSHWTGPLPVLELHADWAYSTHLHHMFGRLTYRDAGVHGWGSTSYGSPTDGYGRNIYVDTYNSRYGSGWKRENAFLAHRSGGNFCYLFFARPSYYDSTTRPPGNGQLYRGTVMGPGVTPIVRDSVGGLPAYSASNPDDVSLEDAMNALGDVLAQNDVSASPCTQH
jgi:hypothetical protein